MQVSPHAFPFRQILQHSRGPSSVAAASATSTLDGSSARSGAVANPSSAMVRSPPSRRGMVERPIPSESSRMGARSERQDSIAASVRNGVWTAGQPSSPGQKKRSRHSIVNHEQARLFEDYGCTSNAPTSHTRKRHPFAGRALGCVIPCSSLLRWFAGTVYTKTVGRSCRQFGEQAQCPIFG